MREQWCDVGAGALASVVPYIGPDDLAAHPSLRAHEDQHPVYAAIIGAVALHESLGPLEWIGGHPQPRAGGGRSLYSAARRRNAGRSTVFQRTRKGTAHVRTSHLLFAWKMGRAPGKIPGSPCRDLRGSRPFKSPYWQDLDRDGVLTYLVGHTGDPEERWNTSAPIHDGSRSMTVRACLAVP